MKTTLFVITLVAIISMAFYIRKGFEKTEEAPSEQQVNGRKKEISGRHYKGGLLPASQWSSAILGEWSFYDKEENENWFRTLSGDIEFFPDGSFRIGYSHKKYDLSELVIPNIEERKPTITAGGSLKGAWQVIDDYIQLSDIKDCDYNVTYFKGVRPVNWDFDPCQYYEGFKLGTVKDKEKTIVQLFNKNRILIEGRRYSTGALISYELNKNEETGLSQR